ncbi:hypothetical protein F9K94_21080 [Brucella tritici]|uniref:Uncharacterized protein n=1 Tax=Brucella tritici TaxID=94626 RepID=A0A7V8B0Z7_9HYPH|nr:hypothetical protein F9K94_21080 [Brucella tritici]
MFLQGMAAVYVRNEMLSSTLRIAFVLFSIICTDKELCISKGIVLWHLVLRFWVAAIGAAITFVP